VGILTSDNRNSWGTVYEKLLKDQRNKLVIEDIQRSIFILCLDQPMNFDTSTPTDRLSLIAGQMNHGWGSKKNSSNRWFDKTMQFIVGSDGAVGLNYEHAPAEGPPIISMVDHTLNYVQYQQTQEDAPGIKEPEKLSFVLSPEIETAIAEAEQRFDSLISDLDIFAYCFDAFGKNFIKGQRLSPDGFIQVAFQLAYYRIYGKHVATYESGSLRRFQLGRTDTIRSCTNASSAYCRAMALDGSSVGEKAALLRKAVQAHRDYTNDVVAGKGVDRHLLGLKLIAIENGMNVPDLFMDPIYDQSVHFGLSTSQVPSNHDAVLCFGPVVPNGYGICYNPMPERLNFVVSAWNSSPETEVKKLANEIRRALMDGHNLLLQTQQSKL
jgi:carnitine O-acetyltransferase